jgi:pimeloyl-ACP methyl ester carboxylesterase
LAESGNVIKDGNSGSMVEVRGNLIHMFEGGEGEPLVILHGAGGGSDWLPYHKLLARSFHVYAPEHPGFGRSPRPDWVDTIEDLVYFYLDFLDTLGLERVHLLGHSLGGWIAAEIALRNSDRLHKVVLADAAGLYVEGHPVADVFAVAPEKMPELRYANPRTAESLPPPDPDLVIRNQAMTARLAWNPRFEDPKLPVRLYRVSVPTLVVWGDSDRMIPIEHGHKYAELIPHARFTVIKDAGHAAYAEQPEDFAKTVTEFLKE